MRIRRLSLLVMALFVSACEVPSQSDSAPDITPGAMDAIIIENGSSYVTSPTVNVELRHAPEDAYYQLSEDVNFTNIPWLDIADKAQWTFTSGGKKTLYARYGTAHGLISTVSAQVDYIKPPSITLLSVGGFDIAKLAPLGPGNSNYYPSDQNFSPYLNFSVEGYGESGLEVTTNPINQSLAQVTAYRFAFDGDDISSASWIRLENPTFWGSSTCIQPHEYLRYTPVMSMPTSLGSHIIKMQVKNVAGTSNTATLSMTAISGSNYCH